MILLSGIGHGLIIAIHIFRIMKACGNEVLQFALNIVFVGHELSAYPVTGSTLVHSLRAKGMTAKVIANSGGGRYGFDFDKVPVDSSVHRNPIKIVEFLCGSAPHP